MSIINEKIAQEICENKSNLSKAELITKYSVSYRQLKIIQTYRFDEFGIIAKNTSIIRQIPPNELAELFRASYSYSEVISKCGLDVRSSYIKLLKKIVSSRSIDVSHFKLVGFAPNVSVLRVSNDEIFMENSKVKASTAKDRILSQKIIPTICAICGNTGEHHGKPLTLQLDHINGNNNDHRLLNLRFLCPNCHSQTETFTGRNQIKKVKYCIDCGVEINKKSIRCGKCSSKLTASSKIKFEVSKEELEKLMSELPMTKIGKLFNVSDNSIRKRCIALGVPLK